jgi:uncharacterized protein GlcG (DUF336 family)
MARTLLMLVALTLALAIMTGPALAASETTMIGTVAAVDKDGKAFTLKADHDEKMYRFQAKDASVIGKVKKGQHIQVTYRKDGAQMIADKVADKARTASKK